MEGYLLTFPITVPTQAESVSIRATNKDPETRQISKHIPSGVQSLSSQPDQTHVGEEYQPLVEEDVVTPVGVGHILGEGGGVFTDMTETMLTALDKQMTQPGTAQRSVNSHVNNLHGPYPMLTQSESRHGSPVVRTPQPIKSPIPTHEHEYQPIPPPIGEDMYPDLYLPVTENYRISDKFCWYTDSVSADNNPMILVELNGLSYKYGPTVYAVDRVNGTMYGSFKAGFRVISERATTKPQYMNAPLAGMYGPAWTTHMSTLSGQTQLVTPLAKSTSVTESSQTPIIPPGEMHTMRDILEPTFTEKARVDYLEIQIQHMGSIPRPPPDMSSNELTPQSQDETYIPQGKGATPVNENVRVVMGQQQMKAVTHDTLHRQVQEYSQKNKTRRKKEVESHRTALEEIRRHKEQWIWQQSQEEWDASYPQVLQDFEWT